MELEFKDDDVDAFGDNDLDDKGEENEGLEPPSSPTSLSQASPQEAQDKGQQREHGGGQEEEQANYAKGTQEEGLEPSSPPGPPSRPSQDTKEKGQQQEHEGEHEEEHAQGAQPQERDFDKKFKALVEEEAMKRKWDVFEYTNKWVPRWDKKKNEIEELYKVEQAKARSPPPWATLPECVDVTIRDKPSALHNYVKGFRRQGAPIVKGATYEYLISEVAHRPSPVAYNIYGRSLPQKALKSLYSHYPWGVHLRGDDLINTFNIMDPEMGGLYYPSLRTPHIWLEIILRDHPQFYVQPIPNN